MSTQPSGGDADGGAAGDGHGSVARGAPRTEKVDSDDVEAKETTAIFATMLRRKL